MAQNIFDNQQWDFSQNRHNIETDVLRSIVTEELQEKINDHQRVFSRIAIIAKDAPSWVRTLGLQAEAIEVADALKFSQSDYDLILHIQALHRMNDPIGQMVQARLKLCPDGVFLAAFLGGETLQEMRATFWEAEADIYNGASPHVAPMIDIKDAGNLLVRAGLALPVADNFRQEWNYQSANALMKDLRQLGLSNPLTARRKTFTRRALFERFNALYETKYACQSGGIYASFELIFLTGYAPSTQQPKPLRPGSITQGFGVFDEDKP